MAMKRRLRKIIVLATALALLSIILYFQNLQRFKRKQAGVADSMANTSSNANWHQASNLLEELPNWTPDDIGVITIESRFDGSTDNTQQGHRLELQLGKSSIGSAWKLGFPQGIVVRTGAIDRLVSKAFRLWGKQLSVSFDLSQETSQIRYGFNQTKLTIDYFGQASNELAARVLIGAEIPGIGGYYATVISGRGFAQKQQKHVLFRLGSPLIEELAVDANGLRRQKLVELALSGGKEQLNALELRNRQDVLKIEFKNEELAQQYGNRNEFQMFVMTKPYSTVEGVDIYALEQLIKKLPNPIQIVRYIEDSPQDLSSYGLAANQRRSIYAEDSQGNLLDLWLGREADIDSIYAMQVGYDSVFTISKNVLSALNFNPFMLVDKFVALININKIEQVQLRVGGGSEYQLKILYRQTQEQLQVEQQNDEENKTEVSGGKLQKNIGAQKRPLSEELCKKLYQSFLNLFLVGEVSDSFFPVDKAEVSMIYSLRNGSQRRIDFYKYSVKGYYVVSIDRSKAHFVTEKLQLENLEKTLNQVLQTGQLDIVK